MKITVFTPTYNRAHLLIRVYESLKKQTCKDFIWLIIDDGSTDNTKQVVSQWRDEKILTIDYHEKPNGGKHTAMKFGYTLAKTKYLIDIDSDDEMKEDTVEVFLREWEKIEKTNLEFKIAEIRALSQDTEGNLIGNFHFPENVSYYDANWQEMVLKRKNFNENITCWSLEKLKECVNIPIVFWLSDEANHFGESILWARIGKKYKTRYINKYLRVYHTDDGESIQRTGNKRKSNLNSIVLSFYFLNENIDFFWLNPYYFITEILILIVYSIEQRITISETLRHMTASKFKVLYLICYPVGFSAWIAWKILRFIRQIKSYQS